jgi:hypothetical protein
MPTAYAANASAGTIGAYSFASRNFELQQRVTADIHSAICSSLGSVTLNEINSKHQFGTGSLTPLDLVTELKTMIGTITKQKIDATQALISAPLVRFLDFCDFCSNIHLNYEFLTTAGHAIPELTRIDSFTRSIEPFTQFDSYLTTWTTSNALGSRTLGSPTKFLLEQYGDMPTEHAPRGGNTFYVGKSKGKREKARARIRTKARDAGLNAHTTTLSSFASSSSAPPAKHARITSNTCPNLTAEHNPARPYRYCWFHGWIFAHPSNECKRILKSSDQACLNTTSPTSTTPFGNAYVELV